LCRTWSRRATSTRARSACRSRPTAASTATACSTRAAADAPPDDLQLVGRFTGLSFEVADIDAVYDTLRGRGVVFAASPERQGWGGTVATLRDPAGNELQIYAWSRA